jgi:hypothetical protein
MKMQMDLIFESIEGETDLGKRLAGFAHTIFDYGYYEIAPNTYIWE